MSVKELTKEQVSELKINYYINNIDSNISYEELADIDNLVSDVEVFGYYKDYIFVSEDFSI